MALEDLIKAFVFLSIFLDEEGSHYVYDHDDIRCNWKGLSGTWH
jgi:hypothetical protein